MGSLDLRFLELFPCSGSGMELFQSQVQRREFLHLLYRDSHHAGHVSGLEGSEEDSDCGVEGDGFGD